MPALRDQEEKRDLRHLTGNDRFRVGVIFPNCSYLETYVYAKWKNTYTHIHTYTQRETGVMTIGKICKEDLP